MAITVLSKKPPKETLRTVTCKNCGWKHQYATSDVITGTNVDLSGHRELWWYIRCQNVACLPKPGYGYTGDDPYFPNMSLKTNYIEVPCPR